MRNKIIYLCISLFVLRVLFIPLFLPFETYGFRTHAAIALVLFYLASRYMTDWNSKFKATLALSMVVILDAFFFILSKDSVYGDYPYYPRYILMTLPIVIALTVIHFPQNYRRSALR